jgi:hypothetical protein
MKLVAGVVVLLLGSSARLAEAQSTSVRLDFLTDGQCAVAAEGPGFHSKATYKRPHFSEVDELRCAMPPGPTTPSVPEARTVALTVTLPAGSQKPGRSTPEMTWAREGVRWTGRTSLTDWPEAVTVFPASGPAWPLAIASVVAALAVLLGIAVAVRQSRHRS